MVGPKGFKPLSLLVQGEICYQLHHGPIFQRTNAQNKKAPKNYFLGALGYAEFRYNSATPKVPKDFGYHSVADYSSFSYLILYTFRTKKQVKSSIILSPICSSNHAIFS